MLTWSAAMASACPMGPSVFQKDPEYLAMCVNRGWPENYIS